MATKISHTYNMGKSDDFWEPASKVATMAILFMVKREQTTFSAKLQGRLSSESPNYEADL